MQHHKEQICVGDIVRIDSGMNVPVDGIVLQSIGIQVDEAAMTGESDQLTREIYSVCKSKQVDHESDPKHAKGAHDVPSCVILSGTQVACGNGYFVAIVVGENTCEGKILASVEQSDNELTPL